MAGAQDRLLFSGAGAAAWVSEPPSGATGRVVPSGSRTVIRRSPGGGGLGDATRLDAELLCEQFLPEALPEDFSGLEIPLTVVASDLYRRSEVVFSDGPLRRALAASIALPTIMRPVAHEGRILVDGGATNPLPFECLRDRADVVMAVEISGPVSDDPREVPNALECLYATVLVMSYSIINEKLRHGAPDLLLQPKVGSFRALGFM